MFWKRKEVEPLPQEVLEILDDERAVAMQPEDGVREIIKDVMEFLMGGDADDTAIGREGIILLCNNTYSPRLACSRKDEEWDEVVLSKKEKEVLAAFFVDACKKIKERKALDNSESALNKISAIIENSKK